MLLSIASIDKLRSLGLQLTDEPFFSSDHYTYPSGYLVTKPIDVHGNSLPSLRKAYEAGHMLDETDAPTPVIWHASDSWRVSVRDWAPGLGPGDFVKSFVSEADAIQFVTQYFFSETPEFSERLAHEYQQRPI